MALEQIMLQNDLTVMLFSMQHNSVSIVTKIYTQIWPEQ